MRISSRNKFIKGDEHWQSFVDFIKIGDLNEVRSIDSSLNSYVDDNSSIECSISDYCSALKQLPKVNNSQYYQFAINLTEDNENNLPENFILLGYDICDETKTSSLLNCGEWKGNLLPFTKKLNKFGLLNLEDAIKCKELLPIEWGEEEPHAFVDIWALYEVHNV